MRSGEQGKESESRDFYEARQLEQIAERWNAKAADWDLTLQDSKCHLNEDQSYARFLEALTAEVARRQNFCREHGVIDVGCGTGLVLASIVSKFAWGLGVDISPDMVRLAQAKDIPNARFAIGDCFQLSAHAHKAGAVVSRGVLLSHYGRQNVVALFESFRSALAPGGFVLCDFLSETAKNRFEHVPVQKTYYTESEICQLASAAGFQITRVLSEPERRIQILLAE
jgi:predicted TPR repeat methyltransferase